MSDVAEAQAHSEISGCRVCGSANLELLLDYGLMPLAGGFAPEGDPRLDMAFPLRLVLCGDCTLMQVADTVRADLIFEQYSYSSSVNRMLVSHFEKAAAAMLPFCGDGYVAEIGCNDGVLLHPLIKRGVRAVGIDPSDVAARASGEQGWPLYRDYFSRTVAEQIRAERGTAAVVAANNVCAHMEDPNVLVEGVATLLAGDGRFIFEVHYAGDLLEQNQFDTVYHEHTCYYSLSSLRVLLEEHGLDVVDVQRIPTHSGSIRVHAARRGAPVAAAVGAMLAEESSWDHTGFARRVLDRRRALQAMVAEMVAAGKRVVAYGASGRATVLLNFCHLGPDQIDHVSDLSPLRHGRSVPGVKVPVLAREVFQKQPPDCALMTAWNYSEEILRDEKGFRENGGVFIIPLPDVVLV